MTPRLDRCIIEFSKIIADPVEYTNDPDLYDIGDGKILTLAEMTSYVNKAMLRMWNAVWTESKGIETIFLQQFPFLFAAKDVSTNEVGGYGIENPNKDFGALIDARTENGNTYIQQLGIDKYNIIKSGVNTRFSATAEHPKCFYTDGVIMFEPASSFANTTVTINYIKLPINPETGDFLTQNGGYDSPFPDHYNSAIAEMAGQLYKVDTQEKA